MNILADATLPGLHAAFPSPFILTYYHSPQELNLKLKHQDILLCRANLKINADLLANHSLQYIATASSGVDHIDSQYLQAHQIKLIDAKGANASSVADYVFACLAYLNANIKTAGIIGLGEVGTKVETRLNTLGIKSVCYDPLKALTEPTFQSCALETLYECDLLCIHAALHNTQPYPSFNLIHQEFLSQLKPGCIIINASRGGIVNEVDLLGHKDPIIYCTDVYENEPLINPALVERATLCTPHIAGHSAEAKYEAVAMVSRKLHQQFGLNLPVYDKPSRLEPVGMDPNLFSFEHILKLYNPETETRYLKNAVDKKEAFLQLRKAHVRNAFKLS